MNNSIRRFAVLTIAIPSICFGTISNQVDLEDYLDYKPAGPSLFITDTADVFEYFDPSTPITNNRLSISYTVSFKADPSAYDVDFDWLAFRLFLGGAWRTIWGPASVSPGGYDLDRIDFLPGIDQSINVVIDLLPYRGLSPAMGWAYISDIPSNSSVTISNITIHTVDEPELFSLIGVGLLIGFVFLGKDKIKTNSSYS